MIGLPNCCALLGVVERVLGGCPCRTGRGRAEDRARGVEGVHQAVEALALVAEPVLVGHEDVVEEDLGVDQRPLAHLLHRLTER